MTESARNHVLVSFHFDTRRRGYYRHSGPVQVVEREITLLDERQVAAASQ